MQVLAPFNSSFAACCSFPSPLDPAILATEPGPAFWLHYRLWAVARMSGRWPLSVSGGREHPASLRRCRACGRRGTEWVESALVGTRLNVGGCRAKRHGNRR
eukprot:3983730-Pyramimonas_sp.AAC.1